MSIEILIERLHGAGFDLDSGQLLDALWLATHERKVTTLVVSEPPAEAGAKTTTSGLHQDLKQGAVAAEAATPGADEKDRAEAADEAAMALSENERAAVFDIGDVTAEDVTIPAAGIILPSARALQNRLPLLRALRPLQRKFPSHQFELDEERTAELTAELRRGTDNRIFAVLRPRLERWFEAHIVIEDDPTIELWAAPLREYTQLLRDSGAFRLVRNWRLRLDSAMPTSLWKARLESPAGGLSSTGSLGAPRQLIFFASHGLSLHWADGCYARLLRSWAPTSTVLLHLQPRGRWAQTMLGEPQAMAHSIQPGGANTSLEIETMWWRPGPDPEETKVVTLPAMPVEGAAVDNWARTLMGYGRKTEAFLLDPRENSADLPVQAAAVEKREVQRSLATLKERFPHSYDLAILLANAPFTIPVARLVQEVTQSGSSDFTVLADLMLSGLVEPRSPGQAITRETTWFQVRDEARPLLLRSLRSADADALAQSIDDRISHHLSDIAGRSISFAALIAHPEGRERLPVWAKEFAHVLTALSDRTNAVKPERTWQDVLAAFARDLIGRLARLAGTGLGLSPQLVHARLWPFVNNPLLIRLEDDGELRFVPAVAEFLQQQLADHPWLGLTVLWVDDNPGNNRRLVESMTNGGATVSTAVDTETALVHRGLAAFDVIISDMTRGDNQRAGYDLLDGLRSRGISAPVLIFAGYGMSDQQRRLEVIEAGAFAGTNADTELLRLVDRAAAAAVLRKGTEARSRIEEDVIDGIARPRSIASIREGDFCTRIEIAQAIGISDALSSQPIIDMLMIYENSRQRSWLATTSRSLVFVLDDPTTRKSGRLVQRISPLEESSYVQATTNNQASGLVTIGSGRGWYYSLSLFNKPRDIEAAIQDLVRAAQKDRSDADIAVKIEANGTTSRPSEGKHRVARDALQAIDIDCADEIILDIVFEAARFRPGPAYDKAISLSRLFCGVLMVARALRITGDTREPMLVAFAKTIDEPQWAREAEKILATFARDGAKASQKRLRDGFSKSARNALARADWPGAERGNLTATSLVEAILTPERSYAASVLYRSLTNVADLYADIGRHFTELRDTGSSSPPTRKS